MALNPDLIGKIYARDEENEIIEKLEKQIDLVLGNEKYIQETYVIEIDYEEEIGEKRRIKEELEARYKKAGWRNAVFEITYFSDPRDRIDEEIKKIILTR